MIFDILFIPIEKLYVIVILHDLITPVRSLLPEFESLIFNIHNPLYDTKLNCERGLEGLYVPVNGGVPPDIKTDAESFKFVPIKFDPPPPAL